MSIVRPWPASNCSNFFSSPPAYCFLIWSIWSWTSLSVTGASPIDFAFWVNSDIVTRNSTIPSDRVLYSVVPGRGVAVLRILSIFFVAASTLLKSAFVIVESPTTATAFAGTDFEPPPQPAAKRPATRSMDSGRKRRNLMSIPGNRWRNRPDAESLRGDVLLGDVRVDPRVDPDRTHRDPPLALELGNGLVQELDVELEADCRDVARLLRPEQLAGAADLEVAHRDREAGAELGVVGERREPGARLRRQLARVRIEEVGVRGLVRAADPSADLVELREAERVRSLD